MKIEKGSPQRADDDYYGIACGQIAKKRKGVEKHIMGIVVCVFVHYVFGSTL